MDCTGVQETFKKKNENLEIPLQKIKLIWNET